MERGSLCFKIVGVLAGGILAFSQSGCGKPALRDQSKPSDPFPESASAAPLPTDGRPNIVAFGDSLTAGFGAEPGKSYPDYLQKLLDADGYKYQVINAGVSGDTSTDAAERIYSIRGLRPKVMILEFGGNDGLRGLPVASTRLNLEKVIRTFKGDGVKILIAGITLPRNYGPEYIRSFDQIYVRLAHDFHLPLVPFLLEGVAGPNTPAGLMQPDSIHPTAAGNQIVAATVLRYLKPLLTK